MLVLRFDVESAYALRQKSPTEANWRRWIDEMLAGVSGICNVLDRQHVPATFFVVGLLLEKAGDDLVSLLGGNPLFDIESHTYSHWKIWKADQEVSMATFREELSRTSDLILEHFGRRPIGFCAPGNFYRGLRGKKAQLEVLREQGIRFIGSDGQGEKPVPSPAPMTQPYWYDEDGFPDLLELPLNGWHCNMLFNTGHQNDRWKPAPGFPDGRFLERLPGTAEEGFQVRRREFEYAIENKLIYAPCMHPWSVYRFDPELTHLEKLIEMAGERNQPVVNCRQLYERYSSDSQIKAKEECRYA